MRGADVRTVAFDLVRGGYATSAVDGALDRLEGAFVRRERAAFVGRQSQKEWMSAVAERATTLYPRLVRPRGERFAPPERGRGYLADDVDEVLDRLVAYFDRNGTLTSAELRGATFRPARGGRAYAEGPVDAYLDRAVEVLLAVE
jgi:DivIVA domain-containing protein